MAQINEDVLVIKVSELIADDADKKALVNEDDLATLKAVIEEITNGRPVLIEIERA